VEKVSLTLRVLFSIGERGADSFVPKLRKRKTIVVLG